MSRLKLYVISVLILLGGVLGGVYLHEKKLFTLNNTTHVVPTKIINTTLHPSPKDILCLKQNIHYEAAGEPFKGKIAVGIVTLNRSNTLNKSICEVVFEPMQFSWTINKKKWVITFSDDVNFAADMVLENSKLIDDLKYATHFHETYTYPIWAVEKKKVAIIGNHTFYNDK